MNAGETTPVTVSDGSLRTGKMMLLDHLLTDADDRDIAVFVNDMGFMNVDTKLVAEESDLVVGGGVTELSNGCICCKLQDDFETAVVHLTYERSFNHLIVEAPGVSEPSLATRLFVTLWAAAHYGVIGLVTVIDLRLFADTSDGGDPDQAVAKEEDGLVRPLSDPLVKQVENADPIVLSERDLVFDVELGAVRDAVEALRPGVIVVETGRGDMNMDLLLSDYHDPDAPVGWRAVLEGEAAHDDGDEDDRDRDECTNTDCDSCGHGHTHHNDHNHNETFHTKTAYGVTSFACRRRAPLDSDDAAAALDDPSDSVAHMKGSLWIIGTEGAYYTYNRAGSSAYVAVADPRTASRPEFEQDIYRHNHPDFDRHDDHSGRWTELVPINREVGEGALVTVLDVHLLDPGTSTDTGDFLTDPDEEIVLAGSIRERKSVPTTDAVPEGRR